VPERTCTTCGSTVPDGARFCTSCGAEAPVAPAPEPHTEPVAQTTELPPAAPAWTPPAAAPPAQPQQPPQQSWSVPAQAAPPAQAWQQPQPAAPAWQQPQQPPQPQWGGAQPQQYAQPAAKKKGNAFGGLLAFLGAILLVAGSFTQWVRTNVETITGWEASIDGKVVVGLAVVALLIGFMLIAGVRNIVLRVALLALGVWAIVIAIVDSIDVGNQLDSLEPAIGIGLILVGAAGVVLLLAGLVTRSKSA
jgi:zinc-ribbon domain